MPVQAGFCVVAYEFVASTVMLMDLGAKVYKLQQCFSAPSP